MDSITTIKQGETFHRVIDLVYAVTDAPVRLTGYTARAQLRDAPAGTLKGTFQASIEPAIGQIDVVLSPAQTSALQPGTYGYDIFLICEEDDEVHCIYTEKLTVVPPYTSLE